MKMNKSLALVSAGILVHLHEQFLLFVLWQSVAPTSSFWMGSELRWRHTSSTGITM